MKIKTLLVIAMLGTAAPTFAQESDTPPLENCTPTGELLPLLELKHGGNIQFDNCNNEYFNVSARNRDYHYSNWGPFKTNYCRGVRFTQKHNWIQGLRRDNWGSKVGEFQGPSPEDACPWEEVEQTHECTGETRKLTGTKSCVWTDNLPHGWAWVTTPEGDEGYFQDGGVNVNETILYNSRPDTVIRRFTSPAGHPYKMWIDDFKPGGFGVNLKDRASFDNWLSYMDEINPSTGNEYHPNKHWCELVEDLWSPWTPTGTVPTQCGVHSYTEERTCGPQGAIKPCPFTCPNGSQSETETRTATIDNGLCACTESWTPATSTVCSGNTFTQTRCAGAGNEETRTATGTMSCGCTDVSWSPATNTQCSGTNFTQTSNCGNTRTATGTTFCGCTDSTWSPSTGTVCLGQNFTQTSNCGNTRTTTGTQLCATIGWDYTTTTPLSSSQWDNVPGSEKAGRFCTYWRAGLNGLDRQRKMARFDTRNGGAEYLCSTVGQLDYCYFNYREDDGSFIADRVNFRCQ